MADGQLPLPAVQRVESGFGSHIEPPMSEAWSERDKLAKLAWLAAVCALDSGLTIRVVEVGDGYCLQVYGGPTGHSSSMSSYNAAWSYLNGVCTGAQVMRGFIAADITDTSRDFQFHMLSECQDQSTCPIHPARPVRQGGAR